MISAHWKLPILLLMLLSLSGCFTSMVNDMGHIEEYSDEMLDWETPIHQNYVLYAPLVGESPFVTYQIRQGKSPLYLKLEADDPWKAILTDINESTLQNNQSPRTLELIISKDSLILTPRQHGDTTMGLLMIQLHKSNSLSGLAYLDTSICQPQEYPSFRYWDGEQVISTPFYVRLDGLKQSNQSTATTQKRMLYIFSVPLDIITSPLQLIGYLISIPIATAIAKRTY